MDINTEWTIADRLKVVTKIADEMQDHLLFDTDEKIIDWNKRLILLCTASKGFLEVNRDAIINGKQVTNIIEGNKNYE